ncbi:MAG: hypothetical protein GY749_34090 [Desulfobacteraceae bacterium]|nr:hypothetical protein [Desulfobacteraceae bacterium]
MSEDKIYRKFMLPFYQAEKQKADQERLRAEQEKERSEQLEKQLYLEKQRAERLEEKLRSLGISIEE